MSNLTEDEALAISRFHQTYISSNQVVEMLQISRPTLIAIIAKRELPQPIDAGGRLRLWEREQVNDKLEQLKVKYGK